MSFVQVKRSLLQMLGRDYIDRVCAAHAFLDNTTAANSALAEEEIDFHPATRQNRLASMLNRVGSQVLDRPLQDSVEGAGSAGFRQATSTAAAPLSACGYYRIGEDGRLYLTSKSEHYHAPLGHRFPGYGLVHKARTLGIPNATHNNTRGYITRLLERELIRTANGLECADHDGLAAVMAETDNLRVLNRVLNLETGSLAVEAALKMVLARFYRIEPALDAPKYAGRIPVILVMGDDAGGLQANYHGTTVLTQILRGMWPGLHDSLEQAGIWKVVTVRPNHFDDLQRVFAEYDQGKWKIAGFFHEIIMMNYGGRKLSKQFLTQAHELCAEHDVPTVVDEIQSCMWSPQLYLFREYGLKPTFVAVGKGFPGGEYPASRLLFSAAMDCLPQFGALVTNGQEELASLSYLITMEWVLGNADKIAALGAYYNECLQKLAEAYPADIADVDGWNHMSTLRFRNLAKAKAFTNLMLEGCLDISAQTYKTNCPPVVLTKLPLIADRDMIDFVVQRMTEALRKLSENQHAVA